MKGPGCHFVERWIFFVVVVTSRNVVGERRACPEDVNSQVDVCLAPYVNQMGTSAKELFMGLNVEIVRSTCTALWSSIRCARELYDVCPESQHPDIEESLAPGYSMFSLCSYPDLYEIYARHMSCYWRHSAYSEKCFEKFRAQTEPFVMDVEDPEAVKTMCSEYSTLVSCVKTNIQIQCNSTEAANLIEPLIRPSVPKNSLCTADTTEKSSQQKGERKTTEPTKAFEWSDRNSSSTLCKSWTLYVVVLLYPTWGWFLRGAV